MWEPVDLSLKGAKPGDQYGILQFDIDSLSTRITLEVTVENQGIIRDEPF